MIFLDRLMIYPTPLNIWEVPRVIMSGWIFSFMQRNPLIAPNPVPTSKMRGMANAGCNFQSAIMIARRTLPNTIWEPMERSIPPLIITNIIPTALIPANDTWRIKVRRFPNVMKFGATNEKRINKKSRIRKGTFFFMRDLI
jgi:hypothetical protein